MDPYLFLFHLAAKSDPSFLGSNDDQSTIITMEANRLKWDYVPDPCGDRVSFATGYVMGRENLGRDPRLPEGLNPDYDLGYGCGVGVKEGAPVPKWDRAALVN